MTSRRVFVALFCALTCIGVASHAIAQAPSAIYTWDSTGNATPNVEAWVKNFGTNSVVFDNAILGTLRITETGSPGTGVAVSDGANRVRESVTAGGGGTDLTGLDYLEFDLGHSGSGNILTQFYVQASTAFNYVTLANLNVSPGMNTYQVPLTGLTPAQAVYVRTMGFQAFDHLIEGNVVWTLNEVRSGGNPLRVRDLVTHNNAPLVEGGLQGAIANFEVAAIQGNNGGQNQTGLSHSTDGSGSLQWTDLGGGPGAAISWGNGTAWNGNTFNNRSTDLSNYDYMLVRIKATDPNNAGGNFGLNAFMQRNNFVFQSVQGGAGVSVPIDGKFHTVKWSLAGMTFLDGVDQTGINLFSHPQNLIINVDRIRFVDAIPEPATLSLLALAFIGIIGTRRRA